MGVKYNTIKRLFDEGKLTEAGLINAVSKNWISEDEKLLICPAEPII